MTVLDRPPATSALPERFVRWFASRGWTPRAHQLELLAKARAGRSVLLIAPTGAGKTLAGFLPSLVELSAAEPRRAVCSPPPRMRWGGVGRGVATSDSERSPPPTPPRPFPLKGGGDAAARRVATSDGDRDEPRTSPRRLISTGRDIRREGGLHTLYISPLKALAVDIARNLERPVAEMALPIRIETRTGDTPAEQAPAPAPRSAAHPAHHARAACADPGVARRAVSVRLAPAHRARRVAFAGRQQARRSAVARPRAAVHAGARSHQRRPVGDRRRARRSAPLSGAAARRAARRSPIWCWRTPARAPDVRMLDTAERLPWAGHSAHHAINEIYGLIKRHKTTLVFVNTRSQAESIFQELWGINDDGLAIALHHGSLDVAQRRKVEAAMAAGTSARGGRDLVARSRHRLGRRRSRDQCRRAEGRLAAAAAHRPRQPPHGRALEGRADPGQPLRGAGMHRGARRHRGERAGHAGRAHRRARRAGAARAGLGLRRAVPGRRSLRRGDERRALCGRSRAPTSTPCSISSRPAATRSRPTSASPRSARAPTGCGASRIR